MGNDSTRAGATATAAKHEEAKRALSAHLQAQGVSIGGLDLGTVLHWVTQIAKVGGQDQIAAYLKVAAHLADDAEKFAAGQAFTDQIRHAHLGAKKWTLGFSATPEG